MESCAVPLGEIDHPVGEGASSNSNATDVHPYLLFPELLRNQATSFSAPVELAFEFSELLASTQSLTGWPWMSPSNITTTDSHVVEIMPSLVSETGDSEIVGTQLRSDDPESELEGLLRPPRALIAIKPKCSERDQTIDEQIARNRLTVVPQRR
jgi:hypothetical protein